MDLNSIKTTVVGKAQAIQNNKPAYYSLIFVAFIVVIVMLYRPPIKFYLMYLILNGFMINNIYVLHLLHYYIMKNPDYEKAIRIVDSK